MGSLCPKGLYFVGPFCRKGLSPQGEPPGVARPLHVAAWPFFPPRLVAGRGEPRSPPRQGGPTEIRDCTQTTWSCYSTLAILVGDGQDTQC